MAKHDYTLDDVRDALQYLDCGDTERWFRVGMAIKLHYGEQGFDIWDGWSQSDARYKPSETKTKWKSFKGGSARGSVRITTVMHWAFEEGFVLERPELTPEEKAKFAEEQEVRRAELAAKWAQEEADIKRWYGVVAETAEKIFPLLKTVGSSPYLGRKKIHSCGCFFPREPFLLDYQSDFKIDIVTGHEEINAVFDRAKKNKAAGRENDDAFVYVKRGAILIPLYNSSNQLRNFQIIYGDGTKKRFLTNGQKSGLFNVIGSLSENLETPVVFVEGFATGASVHMATQWPVIVTFDAYNMPAVAHEFKGMMRVKIFAGDNDWETALELTPAGKNKINTGIVKATEAAHIAGGVICYPDFSGDGKGLSDFNDLHVTEGLEKVKSFLDRSHSESTFDSPMPSYPDDVPDYSDIPTPDYELPADSPDPSLEPVATLEDLLKRYALIEPDGKVWDSHAKKIIKPGAFKNIVRPKVFKEWLENDKRRTVTLDMVQAQVAAAQSQGGGGLGDALRRYVYLYPSSTAWDSELRCQVALGDLRNAIADCYDQWLKHPRRKNLPKENLVFDPTQNSDPNEFINTFRGLPLVPKRNDDLCRNMRHMLWCLCNKDDQVFTWLAKWLAYPIQHVGAKMQTAVLMHSRVHGSGKSFFFDGVMRAVYGDYCRTFGQAELESQYNDWISQALFGVFEEVLSRSQRYSHTGTLKQMITGEKVRINQKYMQGWEESNHMNCVFLSNEVEPLPVEPSDRRLLVVWPEQKLIDELQTGVDAELKAGGASAFYAWLLAVDTSDFSPHSKPPMTEAKQRLIDLGRPAWEVFYEDWKNGRLDVPYCSCRVTDLYRCYQLWGRQGNENVMGRNRFVGYVASYERRRPDVHYTIGNQSDKSSFFLIGQCPADKNQSEWLGGCVQEFERILQKHAQEAA